MNKNKFPNNYFFRQYFSLIEKARSKDFSNCYTEKHHIYPVSIFGPNDKTIVVSYRYHIILHYLLYRGFTVAQKSAAESSSMFAVRRMLGNGDNSYSGHFYPDDLRLAYKACTFIKWSPYAKELVSSSMKERWKDPEYREMQKRSHTGIRQSPETVAKRKKTISNLSEEKKKAIKLKLSNASKKSRKNRIKIKDLDTNIVYESQKATSLALGVTCRTIRRTISGQMDVGLHLEVVKTNE